VALLLLSLDRFRLVNNTVGQENGDRILRELAERLVELVGDRNSVARLRGDEFALRLPGVDARLAEQLGTKVIKALEQPFMVGRLPIEVSGSVGVSIVPDLCSDSDTLLRQADLALQVAKRRGGSCVVYSEKCDPYDPRRLMLLGELRRGIEANELLLHFQPKVDIRSRKAIGAEALVRWLHPREGLVSPDRFIPLAEDGGLIKQITHRVLDQGLTQCQAWGEKWRGLSVAVNLSARNLHDPHLVAQVTEALETRGLAPEQLVLELTESTVMDDPERAGDVLRSLQDCGVALAIDDFGTGYSSLAYLRSLPVAELKIDKSFVMSLGVDGKEESDEAIVRSTNDLGHNLGLSVVAEGVENQRALELLGSMGCDKAQGYHIARPMPADEFNQWLNDSPWQPTAH
jgi:diguanylate cyclase (GGDEF)-like protein